jgi:hypothetical protein
MKRATFSLLLFAIVFPLFIQVAAAQQRSDVMSRRDLSGDATLPESSEGDNGGAPKYCDPCLFYGGDWNPKNLDWISWGNGDDTIDFAVETSYVPFIVPEGETWTVTKLFTNNITLAFELGSPGATTIDPKKGLWSISTGISEGKAGKVVAKGSGFATFNPTGHVFNTGISKIIEYNLLVKLPHPVSLHAGKYWMAAVPECTVESDKNCQLGGYFLTDSIARNHRFGPPQPKMQIFGNGPKLVPPIHYQNGCDGDHTDANNCSYASAGVVGTKH